MNNGQLDKQTLDSFVLIHATENLKHVLKDGALKPYFDIQFGRDSLGFINNGMGDSELYEAHHKESGVFVDSVPYRNFVFTQLIQFTPDFEPTRIFVNPNNSLLVFDIRFLLTHEFGHSNGHHYGLDRDVVKPDELRTVRAANKGTRRTVVSFKKHQKLMSYLRKNVPIYNEITTEGFFPLLPYLRKIYIGTWGGKKTKIQTLLSKKYPHVEIEKIQIKNRHIYALFTNTTTLTVCDVKKKMKKIQLTLKKKQGNRLSSKVTAKKRPRDFGKQNIQS
jgi:hypothetical protein